MLPPDINESDTDFKVVYTHPGGRPEERAERAGERQLRAADSLRAGRGARRRRRGARDDLRGAGAGGRVRRHVRSRGAGRCEEDQQERPRGARTVRRVRLDVGEQGVSRARAFASIDIALERSRAASRDREPGRRTSSASSTRPPKDAKSRLSRRRLLGLHPVGSPRDARSRAPVARLLRLGPPPRALLEGRERARPLRREPGLRLRRDGRLGDR